LRATSRADISRYVTTYIQGKPHVGLALMSNEAQARIKIQPEELMGVAFTEPSAVAPGSQNRGR